MVNIFIGQNADLTSGLDCTIIMSSWDWPPAAASGMAGESAMSALSSMEAGSLSAAPPSSLPWKWLRVSSSTTLVSPASRCAGQDLQDNETVSQMRAALTSLAYRGHNRLIQTSCWHQIESCVLVYKESLLWQNFCFWCQQKVWINQTCHPVQWL